LERINEFIKNQKENINIYYNSLLNIDVSVYEKPKKERGFMEIMAIRLDAIKKILAAFYYENSRFEAICPELEDIMSRIDIRHKIEILIDEKAFINDNAEEAKEITD
jgi:hypothetical protein